VQSLLPSRAQMAHASFQSTMIHGYAPRGARSEKDRAPRHAQGVAFAMLGRAPCRGLGVLHTVYLSGTKPPHPFSSLSPGPCTVCIRAAQDLRCSLSRLSLSWRRYVAGLMPAWNSAKERGIWAVAQRTFAATMRHKGLAAARVALAPQLLDDRGRCLRMFPPPRARNQRTTASLPRIRASPTFDRRWRSSGLSPIRSSISREERMAMGSTRSSSKR
jgi:hypothetical protein